MSQASTGHEGVSGVVVAFRLCLWGRFLCAFTWLLNLAHISVQVLGSIVWYRIHQECVHAEQSPQQAEHCTELLMKK